MQCALGHQSTRRFSPPLVRLFRALFVCTVQALLLGGWCEAGVEAPRPRFVACLLLPDRCPPYCSLLLHTCRASSTIVSTVCVLLADCTPFSAPHAASPLPAHARTHSHSSVARTESLTSTYSTLPLNNSYRIISSHVEEPFVRHTTRGGDMRQDM